MAAAPVPTSPETVTATAFVAPAPVDILHKSEDVLTHEVDMQAVPPSLARCVKLHDPKCAPVTNETRDPDVGAFAATAEEKDGRSNVAAPTAVQTLRPTVSATVCKDPIPGAGPHVTDESEDQSVAAAAVPPKRPRTEYDDVPKSVPVRVTAFPPVVGIFSWSKPVIFGAS
jgi:hypothetical protein